MLDAAGPGWGDVRHVVVTHTHFDHVGSLGKLADRAPDARLHVGAPELDLLTMPLPDGRPAPVGRHAGRLHAVVDDEELLGLLVVATPGHTPGHVAVFDADSGVLVAGDALTNTIDGVLSGSLPEVTVDPAVAADSVRKMSALAPRVILVGHGPPVQDAAAAKLHRLASSQSGT